MSTIHLFLFSLLSALCWLNVRLESVELPQIRSRLNADLTYQVRYRVGMRSLGFSATIEEWGNLTSGQFRVDLVVDLERVTYLFLGPSKNNEIFIYKPFVCQQVTLDSKELSVLKSLFAGGSKRTAKSIQAFALGPLWILIEENVVGISIDTPPSDTKDPTEKPYVIYNLRDWRYRDETSNYTYKLYFRRDREGFLDMLEWRNKRGGNVLGQAILVDFKPNPFDPTVFELPIGYGCQRSSEEPSKLLDLELWPEGELSQSLFEVVTSRLVNEQLNKWESHWSTCHLIQATMHLNDKDHTYYVAQKEFRPDEELERISRTRQITSSLGRITQLLIYSIDDLTGECETRRDDLENLVNFPFSTYVEHNIRQPEEGLNLDLIKYLVEDNKDYHLIKKLEEILPHNEVRREAVYERRLPADQKELYNWNGPVSIVKRFKINTEQQEIKQIIQVFFYSPDFRKLLKKASIKLLDYGKIGMKTLHEIVDISSCFENNEKETIHVRYPIDSAKIAMKLKTKEETIFQYLLVNILGSTTLDLLQLSSLEVEVDVFHLEVRMTILELPLTFTFNRLEKQTLVKTKETTSMIEQVALNEDNCAASCARYNCYQFSFDWSKQRCLVELSDEKVDSVLSDTSDLYSFPKLQNDIPTVWAETCVDPSVPESLHLSPRAIAVCFKRLLDYQRKKPEEIVPLSITVSVPSKKAPIVGTQVELTPMEIVSFSDPLDFEVDDLHEYFTQVEYVVLLEEVGFSSEFVKEHFMDISYERCSEYCADADCRSFAYSEVHMTCDLTNLHKTEDIRKGSISEPTSSIFVLDYLSKFEDFGWVFRAENPKEVVKNAKKHDCAVACMEETKFTCQGFYLCPNSICLMQDVHIQEDKAQLDILLARDSSTLANKNDKCRFFSRSYLSQFSKLYKTAIKLDYVPLETGKHLTLGAENCAKRCIEEKCTAFDVCHVKSYHGTIEPVCRLTYHLTTSNMVESIQKCNTFLLSDKSQFNHIHQESSDKLTPDESAAMMNEPSNSNLIISFKPGEDLLSAYLSTIDGPKVDYSPRGGSFFMFLLALSMGIMIGVALGFAYLQKETLIRLAVRAMDG